MTLDTIAKAKHADRLAYLQSEAIHEVARLHIEAERLYDEAMLFIDPKNSARLFEEASRLHSQAEYLFDEIHPPCQGRDDQYDLSY
jgi:hypothetical protein